MTTNELAAITATNDVLDVMQALVAQTRKGPLTQERIGAFCLAMILELNHVTEAQPHLPSTRTEAA